MRPRILATVSTFRRFLFGTGWLLVLATLLTTVSLICAWRVRSQALSSVSAVRFTAQLLTVAASAGVVLIFGALLLLRRERSERGLIEDVLKEKSAELETQTATAVSLVRDVEAARAQLQKLNEILEKRIEERTDALRISTTALSKEISQNKQAGASLRASESNLLLAHDELERGLAGRTEELERSNHELEQFAYVASHDLQEPLRAISGCVQILEKRYAAHLDARGHQLISHAVVGVARLKELIEGLLAFSRVSRQVNEPKPVSSQAALNAVRLQLESAIQETGAVLTESTALPVVRADHIQLVQVLQNLIGNAIKYRSTEAPRIEVSALHEGEVWVFCVRDNGIGIEPQYFQRVFSIFQRLHTRDEYPGTGIGLAICRRIVEQAGGSMWIESELGKGSSFFFTLPAA